MPQIARAVNKYGDSYDWTPLKHYELVEFIEVKRMNTNLRKIELSKLAGYGATHYTSLVTGAHRFSKESFQRIAKTVVEATPSQLQIELDKQPEKIEALTKKKDHRFSDSIYANDVDLFIEHWNQTETSKAYPQTDPLKVYTTLKTSSEATIKYTYSNWMAAAQNWVKRNPNEYKKIEAPVKIEKPIYGVMSIEQMITKIKAAGYKVMRRTEGWEEI
jgi:hypothetical protein